MYIQFIMPKSDMVTGVRSGRSLVFRPGLIWSSTTAKRFTMPRSSAMISAFCASDSASAAFSCTLC
jgi:hypothetical protein